MLDIPLCLHIPVLNEGETVALSWAVVTDAAGYTLERQFNKTFEEASRGRTWLQFDSIEKAWDQAGGLALAWDQLEALTSTGRTWESLRLWALTWDEVEAKDLTWQNFSRLPHSSAIYSGPGLSVDSPDRGRTWSQFENEVLLWDVFEDIHLTWEQIEKMSSFISWNKMEAYWITWDNIKEKKLAWDDFERIVDYKDHLGANDVIKIGAKTAIYRIRAFGPDGAISGFLTSCTLPVTPIFHRDTRLSWQTYRGARYLVLIEGADLHDTERVPLTFRYRTGVLELEDFIAQNTSPSIRVQVDSHVSGEVRFRCSMSVEEKESWSGCVALVELVAKRDGLAEVCLF